MGTELVKSVLWRAGNLLQDITPQFTRWTEREMVMWLNDGQRDLAMAMPQASSRIESIKLAEGCLQSIETIPAANRRVWAAGAFTTPTDIARGLQVLRVLNVMGSTGTVVGRSLRGPIQRESIERSNPLWETRTASIPTSWLYDPELPHWYWVSPGVKAGATLWARVAYSALPLAIPPGGADGAEIYTFAGSSTVAISVGDEYVPALVDYIVARAMSKDAKHGDAAKAGAYMTLFQGRLGAKSSALTAANPHLQRGKPVAEPMGAAS